jgi:hypothetical protein
VFLSFDTGAKGGKGLDVGEGGGGFGLGSAIASRASKVGAPPLSCFEFGAILFRNLLRSVGLLVGLLTFWCGSVGVAGECSEEEGRSASDKGQGDHTHGQLPAFFHGSANTCVVACFFHGSANT